MTGLFAMEGFAAAADTRARASAVRSNLTAGVQRRWVNGNQAVAWAALASGVRYLAHYPGSPVNGVEPELKRISQQFGAAMTFNDALNEHVATLAAAGVSLCGVRSMVVMKHVGMNVAADPLGYIAYTGVKGGMVIVVGTDPGANASTGEEDVHWYACMMNLPLYEPTSVADTFRCVRQGFEVSERFELPVLVFLPVRLCYSSDLVEVPESAAIAEREPRFQKNPDRYINVGERACRNHRLLIEKLDRMALEASGCRRYFSSEADVGLITRGVTSGHVYESVERLGLHQKVEVLQIDRVYPLPRQAVLDFLRGKDAAVVIEDQDGFLENQIKAGLFNDLDCRIDGKNHFPKFGEISCSQVYTFLSDKFGVGATLPSLPNAPPEVPERLGAFCEGCPHRGTYYAIEKALEGREGVVGGDIGCSSLPPFRADWLMCMNAGIGVAQGMAQVLEKQPVISTGGDGSLFHAGLLSLQSAVQNGIDLIHLVLDNQSVAMTGHQRSPTAAADFDHRRLLKSIGVDRVIDVSANRPTEFAEKLRAELGRSGVRVFWVNGECVKLAGPFRRLVRNIRAPFIDSRDCGTCRLCYLQLACPAIDLVQPGGRDLTVDPECCGRCGTCLDVCPNGAIHSRFICPAGDVVRHTADYARQKLKGWVRGAA